MSSFQFRKLWQISLEFVPNVGCVVPSSLDQTKDLILVAHSKWGYIRKSQHRLELFSADGRQLWKRNTPHGVAFLPGTITNSDGTQNIAIIYNKSFVELINSRGGTIWLQKFKSGRLGNNESNPGVILGDLTQDGSSEFILAEFVEFSIHVFKSDGSHLWSKELPDRINALHIGQDYSTQSPVIYCSGGDSLYGMTPYFICLNNKGEKIWEHIDRSAYWAGFSLLVLDTEEKNEILVGVYDRRLVFLKRGEIVQETLIDRPAPDAVVGIVRIIKRPHVRNQKDVHFGVLFQNTHIQGEVFGITYDGKIKWCTALNDEPPLGAAPLGILSIDLIDQNHIKNNYIVVVGKKGGIVLLNWNGEIISELNLKSRPQIVLPLKISSSQSGLFIGTKDKIISVWELKQ